MLKRIVGVAGLITLFAAGGSVKAQNETGVQFNLSTPGARSLAMGGAFLGLADDSTAAYTNPAGLTNLTVGGPEVALELRTWNYSSLFIRGGRINGQPSFVGIDSLEGLNSGVAESEESGLSFLSVAYIFPGGLTAAVYTHRLVDFSKQVASQGVFSQTEDEEFIYTSRTPPYRQFLDAQIVNYGVSGAYEWQDVIARKGGDSLSIGIGISRYELDLNQETYLFDFSDGYQDDAIDRMPGFFYGPADFLPDNLVAGQFVEDQRSDQGFNLGVLWRFGKARRWSLGAVYRQGPEFRVDGFSITEEGRIPAKGSFHVPDVYGMGLAYSRAEGRTKFALDYDLVKHSQRFDDLVPKGQVTDRSQFRLNDAGEIHFGVEQVFAVIESQIIGIARFGTWYDPSHELEYHGPDDRFRVLYPEGEDDLHWSGGIGLVIKEDFQIDAAIDLSDRVDTVSFSIVRFF